MVVSIALAATIVRIEEALSSVGDLEYEFIFHYRTNWSKAIFQTLRTADRNRKLARRTWPL